MPKKNLLKKKLENKVFGNLHNAFVKYRKLSYLHNRKIHKESENTNDLRKIFFAFAKYGMFNKTSK